MHDPSVTPRSRRSTLAGLVLGLGLLAGAGLAWSPLAAAPAEPPVEQSPDGKKLYNTFCATCHQGEGQGVPGMFPPLANSEWVTGDPDRLVKVILHGLTGPIEVNGEAYAGTMPPWGGALKDAELAAVATYVRSSWGNDAPAVTAATVAQIRKETAARKTPWTAKELALSQAPVKE